MTQAAQSATPSVPAPPDARDEFRRHRWTIEQYEKIALMGLLNDHRTELIDGEIIDMASQNDPHRVSVSRTVRQLMAVFDEPDYLVTTQSTLRLSPTQAPEPDAAVEAPQPLDPGQNVLVHPLLVIEVSDETLLYDQIIKGSLYAAHGVEDYWIVNINDRQLEVYREPVPDPARRYGWRYVSVMVLRPPAQATPLIKPSAAIEVGRLLP